MFPIIVLCIFAAAAIAGLVLVLRGVIAFPLLEEPPSTRQVPVPVEVRPDRW
ncbi:hypothetical protein JT358_12610 [Micrococcales bacterium 31B]|nr:hypothetical protein [Micrococcales bacterium 31B]